MIYYTLKTHLKIELIKLKYSDTNSIAKKKKKKSVKHNKQ
jgi:hypothetical protein